MTDLNQIVKLIDSRDFQIRGNKKVARKEWQCTECGKVIPVGKPYHNRTIHVSYRHIPILSEHYCLSCGEPEPILKRILEKQRIFTSV